MQRIILKKIKMKKILIVCSLFIACLSAMAQHRPVPINTYEDGGGEEEGGGFKKDHVFVGGTLNIGYNGYDFNAGGSPEIGYSFNKWFDAGFLVNLNYFSERADPNYVVNENIRTRSFNYGTGAFARFYPLPFLFAQIEPEFNFINYKFTTMPSGPTTTYNTNAGSLLVGAGYGRRFIGQSSFYLLVLFDVGSNPNSPYRDSYNNTALPVIKAGFDIYLHPKRR